MKLFVDDLRKCPDGWLCVRTVTEAVRCLATLPIEAVSLDHDIVCEYTTVYDEDSQPIRSHHCAAETFEAVAWYIALMPKKPEVIFHTGNFGAGQRMADIIGVPYRTDLQSTVTIEEESCSKKE